MVEFDDEFASPSDYARVYRDLGLQVVPSHSPNEGGQWKRPFGDWLEFQETLAPDAVFARWYDPQTGEHRGRYNMGLVCGRASGPGGGLLVIDLDNKPDSLAFQWWAGLLAVHNNGMEPETASQRTGGGGRQLLFYAPEGYCPPTFKAPAKCVDVRGQGGFIVCPPSRHTSGQAYDWEPGRAPWQTEIGPAPEWLLEAVEALREEAGGSTGPQERTASDGQKNAFGQDVDDREHKLQATVWAMVVDLYRESPIPPAGELLEAEIQRVWTQYELTTKSRLQATKGETNAELLEREGRGISELRRKVAYALKRWDTKVKAAAAEPRPGGSGGPSENPSPGGQSANEEAGPRSSAGAVELLPPFLGEPPPRLWRVPDWIAEGVVNSFYGEGGTGKSLVALQLMASTALGLPWLGLETKPGRTLGIFCEDEPGELERRTWDVKQSLGCPIGWPFGDRLQLSCRVGDENRLVLLDRQGNIGPGPFLETLEASVRAYRPDLLVLDTLADVYGANENAREQVNWFLKTALMGLIHRAKLADLSLTVLLLGHPSLSGAQEGGRGYSGSGAWEAGVRSRLYLSKPETGGQDERILTRGKANYASAGDETALRLIWRNGVFEAIGEFDVRALDAAKRRVVDKVAWAWGMGFPYVEKRGHRRCLEGALPTELTEEGLSRSLVLEAIRECIDEGSIFKSQNKSKRGWRTGDE